MSKGDLPDRPFPDLDYNRPRRGGRSTHYYMRRRALKRRLSKIAFLAVVVAASLVAAYLLGG
jgi:hypothetical protein